MKRLILTTSDSGAGCLKAARIADQVFGFTHRLVSGPVPPVSDPEAFFVARRDLLGEMGDQEGEVFASSFGRDWLEVVSLCETVERIEIWPDPCPNAQLQLIQLVDWLSCYPEIVWKLAFVHSDERIGERRPQDAASLSPQFQKAGHRQLETAKLALRAFQQSTPQAWFDLLGRDVEALPHLGRTVLRLLKELPAVDTALGATESALLNAVSEGETRPMHVLGNQLWGDPLVVLDYWELGRTLDRLASCKEPVVLGLDEGPFTSELHSDRARFERYKASKLSLSELGRALVENREDFARHNAIERWWGGTKLTNDRLWRWDRASNALMAPGRPA
ncbi:MAG: hypothetical protein ACHQAY_22530 [Hyphomicrobiales bacterium]